VFTVELEETTPLTALNQAVRRNLNRFPEDFMFQLTVGRSPKLEITGCDFKLGRSPKIAIGLQRAWCFEAFGGFAK
jgi:hypothetical protein